MHPNRMSKLQLEAPEVVYHQYQPGLEVSPHSSTREKALIPDITHYVPFHYYHPTETRSSIFGLSELGRGIMIGVLIGVVIAGISLGGGLGSQLAACQSIPKSTNSSSPLPVVGNCSANVSGSASAPSNPNQLFQDFVVPAPTSVDTIGWNCSSGVMTTIQKQKFTMFCGQDFNFGKPGENGGPVADIVALTAYSVSDCLNACAELNVKSQLRKEPQRCKAIAFNFNMRNATLKDRGNCWLKNSTMKNQDDVLPDLSMVSAALLS